MGCLLSIGILCGIIYLVMQLSIAIAWLKVPVEQTSAQLLPISVIIAARNEAYNLQQNLPTLLTQAYATYEVILVLDRCSDDSEQIVDKFMQKYSQLKKVVIHSLPSPWTGKKWAIQQGISAASYNVLAFTDADCAVPTTWLSQLNHHFDKDTELVLGMGAYKHKAGLLNLFIQFETAYTAFQYIGLAQLGMPYMGVGRNMAYRKSFFDQAGGMESIKHRLSGDDDLLVNAAAKPSKTKLMIKEGSRTLSEPKLRWGEWIEQKWRHVSASTVYSIHSKCALGLLHLTHAGFFATILASFALGLTNTYIFTLYSLRVGLSWLIFIGINHRLGAKRILLFYPILDLMFFIYNLIIVPIGLIAKPKWKK